MIAEAGLAALWLAAALVALQLLLAALAISANSRRFKTVRPELVEGRATGAHLAGASTSSARTADAIRRWLVARASFRRRR